MRIPIVGLLLVPMVLAAQEGMGGGGARGGTEIVRGQVHTSEGHPLEGALVTVTGLQSRTARTARTNDKGHYTVLFLEGEGEYVVTVRSIAYAPTTVRVVRRGEMNVLIGDVVLARNPVQLDSITVVAKGDPALLSPEKRSIGGGERDIMGGALFSLDPSDLSELAFAVPGVLQIPGSNGGYSVLGMSPDQNNVLVDGSTFSGNMVPPDAIASASIATTTFDPSRGGFSGGQMSIRTRRGTDRHEASIRGALAHPSLAWADPASTSPLARNLTWSGGASGPIKRGVAHYMAALSVNDRSSNLQSLLDLSDLQLAIYGLSRDTIDALATRLGQLGIPLTMAGIPDRSTGDQRSGSLRIDATPTPTTALTLSAMGSENHQLGAGITALGFPSQGGGSSSRNLSLQLSGSAYLGGFVDEVKTSFQHAANSSEPFLFLPRGTVRVGTDLSIGGGGLTSLSFGGGTAGITRSNTRSWETSNELSWISSNNRHRLQFGQSVAYSWSSASNVQNPFGTFSYQSLADLAANQPASYSRTLSSYERSSTATNSALWTGGQWRSSKESFQLQYGLRLDMARSGTTPQYNPSVDSLFGYRTDRVPHDLGLSPRLGFTWTPRGSPAPVGAGRYAQAFGARGFRQPITISGGVGAFRGVIQPSRIASMVDATGLPSTTRQLSCVGDATPIPDWTRYMGDDDVLPVQCLDGTAPVVFATDKPNVRLFDPGFRAPLSWRGDLQVNGMRLHGWFIGLGATYSLGLNGESGIDLNLRRDPVFTLPEESNRPVFVPPDGVVPSTGAVAPGASRVTDRFGSVMSSVSDLKSVTSQLSVSLSPPGPLFNKVPLQLNYTLSRGRAQDRGFTGSTAGDPFVREWAAGQQPTHQITTFTSFPVKWFRVSLRANLTSGRPYTPMVGGDVNGDGRNDDRAFIFDPATTADTALARQMSGLLATAPSGTRACLTSQLGTIAKRNSCRTGWALQPDVNLGLNLPSLPWQRAGVGDHVKFSVTTSNAMGALLRVLGLSNTALGRATNANAYPDPTLLYVDGFDPATNAFKYRVNQQFGDGHMQGRSGRGGRYSGPFQVQLGAELKFGGTPNRSMAQQLGLVQEDKKAKPLTAEQVQARLHGLTSNPVAELLRMQDTLLLTGAQVERIEAISERLDARTDALFRPLVQYVVEKNGKVKDAELQKRIGKLLPQVRALMSDAFLDAHAVLTKEQQELIPPSLQYIATMAKDQQKKGHQ